MSFYPPKINEKFQRPRRAGKIADATAKGVSASFVCGTFIRFFLVIDANEKQIITAQYQTDGCGFTFAAAEILAETVAGKKLTELHGLNKSAFLNEIEKRLGKFPAARRHCAEICLESLQKALADYRSRRVEEFSGEKILICSCFGVSEETIEKVIAENDLTTVGEVGDWCSAGTGCGSCQMLIAELIFIADN